MAGPRSTGRGRPKRPAGRGPRAESGPAIKWSGFRPFLDYWGVELKRYYQLETLASATEHRLVKADRFIAPSVSSILGDAPLTSLSFHLEYEREHALTFRFRAGNAKRKSAVFAYVAAKNDGGYAEFTETEHRLLGVLYARAAKHVVRPFLGGTVYLPGRTGRPGREIFGYCTQWLMGHAPLGVTNSLQFFVNADRPHLLSIAQTEALKGQIIEIMAATYDARAGDAMALPHVTGGDFAVRHDGKGTPRIKLVACRKMQGKLTPARYVNDIIRAEWPWGGQTLRLAPEDPAGLLEALQRARGKEEGRAWAVQFLDAWKAGSLRAINKPYAEALRAVLYP